MTVYFVLVKPAVPENIGAAARAIKTMGFSKLRIVGSEQHLQQKARVLAHGAQDVMDSIVQYDDLSSALADIDWVIGTSAKRRLGKRYNYSASALKSLVASKGNSVKRIAVVFGCEESGLSNDQLDCCDVLASIPIAQPYPSLNLSQAVMIFAYSLSDVETFAQSDNRVNNDVEQGSWTVLKKKVADLLTELKVGDDDKLRAWTLERLSVLTQKDVDFFHLLLGKINKSKKYDE